MFWFGTLMLDVGTLGLSSLRNGMYVDVAKGTYERAGVMLLGMATGTLCGAIMAPIAIGLMFRKIDEDGRPNSMAARVVGKNWVFVTFSLIFATFFFVSYFRINYVVRASSHVEQLLHITAPFMSEQSRLMHRSELAQIKTKEDYVALVNNLRNIAFVNNVPAPEFSVY